jgi:hypothetical protein
LPISFKHHAIFAHIPKTGGQSLYKALDIKKQPGYLWGHRDDLETHHLPIKIIKTLLPRPLFDAYFKFTVVRNPFDRMVSEYFYKRVGDKRHIDCSKISFEDFVEMAEERTFEVLEKPHNEISHFLKQIDFIYDDKNKMALDKIYKYETDFSEIGKRFQTTIPHINRTKHKPYQEYYNDKTEKIVSELYQEDFETFGYLDRIA